MKHCNTINDTMYKKNRGVKLESLVQLLLLLIGLSGVLYISRSHHHKVDWQETATSGNPAYDISLEVAAKETFHIEGAREAGAPLLLVIDNYDENESYVLDTGAGNKIVLEDSATTLRFPAAGIYDLKLWIKDGENWQLAQRKKLQIEEEATVVLGL